MMVSLQLNRCKLWELCAFCFVGTCSFSPCALFAAFFQQGRPEGVAPSFELLLLQRLMNYHQKSHIDVTPWPPVAQPSAVPAVPVAAAAAAAAAAGRPRRRRERPCAMSGTTKIPRIWRIFLVGGFCFSQNWQIWWSKLWSSQFFENTSFKPPQTLGTKYRQMLGYWGPEKVTLSKGDSKILHIVLMNTTHNSFTIGKLRSSLQQTTVILVTLRTWLNVILHFWQTFSQIKTYFDISKPWCPITHGTLPPFFDALLRRRARHDAFHRASRSALGLRL